MKATKAKSKPAKSIIIGKLDVKALGYSTAVAVAETESMAHVAKLERGAALLAHGRAISQLEQINPSVDFYAEARIGQGIAESTVNKEKSQLRNICRACISGARSIKAMEDAMTKPDYNGTDTLAAVAKKNTKKEYLPKGGSGNHGEHKKKTKVTDREFKSMLLWVKLLSTAQFARLVKAMEAEIRVRPDSDDVVSEERREDVMKRVNNVVSLMGKREKATGHKQRKAA